MADRSDQGSHGVLDAMREVLSAARHDEPHVSLVNIDKDDANAAATGAALAHVLSRPDSIRQRAQNAATISSAFAAALVIAGVSQLAAGSESYKYWTIALMFCALAAWSLSVGLFIYAVTFIDKETSSPSGYSQLVVDYERLCGQGSGEDTGRRRSCRRCASTYRGSSLCRARRANHAERQGHAVVVDSRGSGCGRRAVQVAVEQ